MPHDREPSGEIRGQVLPAVAWDLQSRLTEVRRHSSDNQCNSTGACVLNASGTQLSYTVTFNGLVPQLLTSQWCCGCCRRSGEEPGNCQWDRHRCLEQYGRNTAVHRSMLVELLHGRLYMNATRQPTGGEVRGQVLMLTGAGFAVKLDGLRKLRQ